MEITQYEVKVSLNGETRRTHLFASRTFAHIKAAEYRRHYTKVMGMDIIQAPNGFGFTVPQMGVEVAVNKIHTYSNY